MWPDGIAGAHWHIFGISRILVGGDSTLENPVALGGHNVPPVGIRRRYAAGLRNFFGLYRPVLDEWRLYDASRLPPKLVAVEQQKRLAVQDKRLFTHIVRQAE